MAQAHRGVAVVGHERVGGAVEVDERHRPRRRARGDAGDAGNGEVVRRMTEHLVDAVAELWYDDIAALKAAAASPQMKAVTDNGALHLGAIKSFITEEVAIIP